MSPLLIWGRVAVGGLPRTAKARVHALLLLQGRRDGHCDTAWVLQVYRPWGHGVNRCKIHTRTMNICKYSI